MVYGLRGTSGLVGSGSIHVKTERAACGPLFGLSGFTIGAGGTIEGSSSISASLSKGDHWAMGAVAIRPAQYLTFYRYVRFRTYDLRVAAILQLVVANSTKLRIGPANSHVTIP